MNSAHHLILASGSPRRKELLQKAGYKFEVVSYDFDEILPEAIQASDAAEYLAKEKNTFYRSKLENQVIITSDTTVVLDNKVYNKPKDAEEALEMIRLFSGKSHEVISGVCISSLQKTISFSSKTVVTFSEINNVEAQFYVDQFKPFDKAGAYGIQEWIGLTKISKVEGSFFNVVGLPIQELYDILKKEFDISPLG
ncbi:MAG: septum formation protein [Cyclobacteriaceae bacterium]|jgi:septum formation protein